MTIPSLPHEDPDPLYRRYFVERVLNLAPRSVLDVGCGNGGLLASLRGRVADLHGVDPDPGRVAHARAAGVAATHGSAYDLPFAARSVDLVTFQFVPHHLADWPRALAEALRVARRGVLVLEGWYDRSVPSQETAARLDSWSKAIDRATGMVHDEYPSVGQMLASVDCAAGFSIEHQTRLILRARSLANVASECEIQAAKSPTPAETRKALERLLTTAQQTGVSYEGAAILAILLP